MQRMGVVCCLLAFVLLVLSSSAPGQVPSLINYQGRLLNGTNLVSGDVSLSLRLYTTASGGTRIYEDSNTVAVVDGLYSTQIGDNTTYGSLEQALDHTNLYIEVWVNGVALSPREPLAAVAFARQSGPRGVGNQETGLHSFVGGGETNIASDYTATVGGGRLNQANGDYSTVGGGRNNEAVNFYDTVAGGYGNTATGQRSTVGGGQGNTAGGFYSTIPGGMNNIARGDYSLAAGRRAQASNDGCFVWSDSEDADFTSTDTNQFIIRAEGGVGVGTTSPRQQLSVGGYLDLYSGTANSPTQPSIRGSVLGHLFLNGRGNGDVYINSDSGSNLIVNINGGHVGIGTNNPPAKLSVAGDAYITEVVYAESFVGNGAGLTSLDGANIAAGTVDNAQLANGAVTSNKIAASAVNRAKIAANAVDTSEIADLAVTSNKLANGAVGTTKLANNSVTSSKIAVDAVGNSELAADAVDTDEIVDGSVTESKLQDKYWKLNGNADTTNAAHFIGTTDDEALDLKVSGRRVLRLQPSTTYTPNLIGGDSANTVSNDAMGCAIAGGGSASVPNRISDEYGFVGAGFGNVAGDSDASVADAQCAAVMGGRRNTAGGYSSAVGGGDDNEASGQASFVGGGRTNVASGSDSCIAGGKNNTAGNSLSAIGGGSANTVTGMYSVIAGGVQNVVGKNDGVIGGGTANTVQGFLGVIGGGNDNLIEGEYSAIGGGTGNRAYGDQAFIGGGTNNYTGSTSRGGAIGGGDHNSVEGIASVVAGGADNEAETNYAAVCGGHVNTAHGLYSFVGGGEQNDADGEHSTVGGGQFNGANGDFSTIGGGVNNYATDTGATVAGGIGNQARFGSTVAGGMTNYARGEGATIGGGLHNTATGRYTTVGGGAFNAARGEAGTVAGGVGNVASTNYAAVLGGVDNDAHGEYSMVVGGHLCFAGGKYSFAAGRRAQANFPGCFVWSDTNDFDFVSTNNNAFSVRCTGGARFVTDIDGSGAPVAGVILGVGGGSWNSLSDRRMKENFADVDEVGILEKLSQVPVTTWNLISQDPSVRHIGPMAQDFNAAFGCGELENCINDSDARGVTMAAVQGLYKMVKDLQTENAELRREVELLKAR